MGDPNNYLKCFLRLPQILKVKTTLIFKRFNSLKIYSGILPWTSSLSTENLKLVTNAFTSFLDIDSLY